ncbi:23S rRNA (adenine(2503)-C(2))-methyltransferase RlmN [Alienimonas chondri]|uniref:Probable dual-specificity RNA methyltransferase RlmN n=1 Tax=Alienimonas chondri TaxID=2681879 RepID=A0ABX1VE80_9PLAN|nr:23S rRNA (adenine(2503)-C(2))-methyltransferase RlmN [Alienimonas chondri]NNJ25598.1 putative dual-specificity RNA methyltransferase RlmN [Alienimonas chondri]
MPAPPPSLLNLGADGLCDWLTECGEKPFRAKQIRNGIFSGRVESPREIATLPAPLRERIAAELPLFSGEPVRHQVARDRTEKLLLRFADPSGKSEGHHVECVLMRETGRRTVCISTQVGCAMGCVFCASGIGGVQRDLTRGEILEQVLRLDRLLPPADQPGGRITNVVVMGIGEPLANLRNLTGVLEELTATDGLGLSPRRITVSTVGLPAQMRKFAELGKPYNLAVSLHAPNDELRSEIVPINRSTGLQAVLEAADSYFGATGRRVTYEYVLMAGVNDQPEHASELGRLLAGRRAHVNLIPMNDVAELDFSAPGEPATDAFFRTLNAAGVPTTVRKRKGADIDAACGQLRRVAEREPVPLTV